MMKLVAAMKETLGIHRLKILVFLSVKICKTFFCKFFFFFLFFNKLVFSGVLVVIILSNIYGSFFPNILFMSVWNLIHYVFSLFFFSACKNFCWCRCYMCSSDVLFYYYLVWQLMLFLTPFFHVQHTFVVAGVTYVPVTFFFVIWCGWLFAILERQSIRSGEESYSLSPKRINFFEAFFYWN